MQTTINYEAYFELRFGFLNPDGGRGFDNGIRILSECPECGDRRGKAWLNIFTERVKCFRDSCSAYDGERAWKIVQRLEDIASRGETLLFLMQNYSTDVHVIDTRVTRKDAQYEDWCRLPKEMRLFSRQPSVVVSWFLSFTSAQWGIGIDELIQVGAGFCTKGRYAWRIIFPIVMNGQVVAFQARTIKKVEGSYKYLNSRRGLKDDPQAECGRPAEACVYNYDAIVPGSIVIMMEGIGDRLRYGQYARWFEGHVPIALLGTALSSEKICLIKEKDPSWIVVALDNEPEAQERCSDYMDVLAVWGFKISHGEWVGGKDAGSGAQLHMREMDMVSRGTRRLYPRHWKQMLDADVEP